MQANTKNSAATPESGISKMGLSEEQLMDQFYALDEKAKEIRELEQDIELAQNYFDMGEAFRRLEENADFKLVVEEGFIKEVPFRLVKALGGNLKPEARADYQMAITGVGVLQNHFEGVMQFAARARLELPLMKNKLAELQGSTEEFDDGDQE